MVDRSRGLDAASVRAFLTARFGPVEDVEPLAGGEWSQAFGFRLAGRPLVARFGSVAGDYEKDRVAASWSREGLPISDVVEVGEAFEGAYAISSRVFGTPIEELDADGWRAVLPSLFEVLDAMRALDLPGQGYGRWRADGTAPHDSWRRSLLAIAEEATDARVRGWRARLASIPLAESRFDRAYDLLTELVRACPEVRHVVHGDLTAGNVLVDGSRIAGVFDWANSVVGDPLYDIAWLAFWAPWHPGLAAVDVVSRARGHFDEPAFDERVRCYTVYVGLDAQVYNAVTFRWDELTKSARRTLEIATA